MKALSGKTFCRLLERHGWQLLRVQGSHHVYGKPGQRARISVPVHGNRPLKAGLQRQLLKLTGIQDALQYAAPRDRLGRAADGGAEWLTSPWSSFARSCSPSPPVREAYEKHRPSLPHGWRRRSPSSRDSRAALPSMRTLLRVAEATGTVPEFHLKPKRAA